MSLPHIRPAPESLNLPKCLKHDGQPDHPTELAMRIGMPQTRVGLGTEAVAIAGQWWSLRWVAGIGEIPDTAGKISH